MALVTGTVSQGEARVYTASVQCDACPARATREEAATPERAGRLAVWRAQEQGFVTHDRGRKWLCPACRLRSLPEQLRRLFPRLLAQHDVEPPPPEEAAPPKRRRR
jgi:hypothetical protein